MRARLAMGAGITLVKGDLRGIARARLLSRATMRRPIRIGPSAFR